MYAMFLLLCSALIFDESKGNSASEVSTIENAIIIWFTICVCLSLTNVYVFYKQMLVSKQTMLEDEQFDRAFKKARSQRSADLFITSQLGAVTVTKNPVSTGLEALPMSTIKRH
jgi:hypothetical protein